MTSTSDSSSATFTEPAEQQAVTHDSADIAVEESDAPVHDPHLAHHYRDARQQFEAAKLGMWLFLATEFLLFGGLFCLYAVFRSDNPELFSYGAQFLDTKWGTINTAVLILSSLTMAFAVRAAQLRQKKLLVTCLGLTIAGGGAFMGIKYVEYSHKFHDNLVWGVGFYELPEHLKTAMASHDDSFASTASQPAAAAGDAAVGKTLWMATCRSCHGVAGEGMPGQGKDIRGSEFVESQTDSQLVDFIKVGRMPFDPANTTGIQMPPKGGNPLLKDEDLMNIVAYIRTFEAAPQAAESPAADGESGDAGALASSQAQEEEFYIPKSSLAYAPRGPAGLAPSVLKHGISDDAKPQRFDPRLDPNRPLNLHRFFGIYFLMTGLHGIHVLVGMGLISWLLVRASLGHFTSGYFTPVDLTGLYWHVVDVIWIFLFPLFYLIH